ncbi:hypothetical protein H9P43_007146 [Blastocladiella emersonii ATCC 22665]|nr:hypothetical protein H9P43_007146 [Blastocladiella emersonii ATCC 22665]
MNRLPVLLALVLALASAATAIDVSINTPAVTGWAAGSTQTVTWGYDATKRAAPEGAKGTLQLLRINGNPENISDDNVVATLARVVDAAAGSAAITAPADLASGDDYALRFVFTDAPASAAPRFSATFKITGGSGTAPAATTGSPTGTVTAWENTLFPQRTRVGATATIAPALVKAAPVGEMGRAAAAVIVAGAAAAGFLVV